MIRVKVVVNREDGVIDVYIHGLEKVYEILKKHRLEQGDDEDGVLTWFWYLEDVNVEKLVDDLKKVVGAENVYVEEQ